MTSAELRRAACGGQRGACGGDHAALNLYRRSLSPWGADVETHIARGALQPGFTAGMIHDIMPGPPARHPMQSVRDARCLPVVRAHAAPPPSAPPEPEVQRLRSDPGPIPIRAAIGEVSA